MKTTIGLLLLCATATPVACVAKGTVTPVTTASLESIQPSRLTSPVLPAWDGPKFSPPPAAGVHPRVLISPEDLPAVRERLQATACGRRVIEGLRGWVNNAIFKNNAPLGKTYAALVAGDGNALQYAESDWWRGNISLTLSLEAFDCLLRDDAERGKKVAAALVTYNNICGGVYKVNNVPNADFSMGLCYDFAYNFMTDEQRNSVRTVIAKATSGQHSHGMDMQPYERNYNWMPHGTQLALLALSIEGEAGYDPEIYRKTVPLMKDFFTYGIYPSGTPTEGTHYFNYGMSYGAQTLVAMAKRGDVLFNHPHYLAAKQWYLNSMEPFGYAFSMMCDTPNDNGGLLPNYVAMKWAFPNDPLVDFVWRNRVHDDYSGINYRGDLLFAALFPSDWHGGQETETRPQTIDQWGVDAAKPLPAKAVASWDSGALHQPLSYFCPDRGLLVARDHWGQNGLEMNFECRPDVRGPSHAHSDRGNFTLSALGYKWAIDRGFHVAETKDHSCILIDGKGQGYFGAPGRILAYLDTPLATVCLGDAAYAYGHRYTFKGRTGSPAYNGATWEPERYTWDGGQYVMGSGPVTDKNDDSVSTYKSSYNPVAYAFRSLVLVRGNYSYVLVLDDIRKDTAEHRYEWLMQTPNDREFSALDATRGTLKVAQTGENAPQLLVQVLDGKQTAFDFQSYKVERSPESDSTEKFGDGKRLIISSTAVEPNYKVLLFPHQPNQPLPTVTWNTDHRRVRIAWPGQVDEIQFEKQPDGRTGFGLVRNAGAETLVVGLREFSPKAGGKITQEGAGGNIALVNNEAYISGTGWKSCLITGSTVSQLHHDGSVEKVTVTAGGLRAVEAVPVSPAKH